MNNIDYEKRKQQICEYYCSSVIKKINYNGILSENEIKKFVMAYLNNKIDSFVNVRNESYSESKLLNYIRVVCTRVVNYFDDEEHLLVLYNRIFSNRYDDTLKYLYYKYKYILNDELKKNNIKDVSSNLIYEPIFKEIIKEYLYLNIIKAFYLDDNSIRLRIIKAIEKRNKKESGFDYYIARNGSVKEKEEQVLILLDELKYVKDYYKNKYIYYTSDDKVDDRINSAFENYIKAYVYGISDKSPATYVDTRIDNNLKEFANKLKKVYEKEDTEYLFAKRCMPIIISYINNSNLSKEEFSCFIDYCNNAFYYYVNKGSYKEDIRTFMFNVVNSYDNNFAKEVSVIKKHL